MKRASTLALATMFAAAWFLPVVNDSLYEPKPSWPPGLDAFLVALGLNDSSPSVLSVISAATNLLMVAALVWLLRAPRTPIPWIAAWLLGAATLLNLLWAWPTDDHVRLSVGYWLWATSFALAAALLFLQRRAVRTVPSCQSE